MSILKTLMQKKLERDWNNINTYCIKCKGAEEDDVRRIVIAITSELETTRFMYGKFAGMSAFELARDNANDPKTSVLEVKLIQNMMQKYVFMNCFVEALRPQYKVTLMKGAIDDWYEKEP